MLFDENKKSYHYWIIFKLADVFVGPLEYESYIDLCRINNIPFDLYKYFEPINQKPFFIKGPNHHQKHILIWVQILYWTIIEYIIHGAIR